MPAAALRTLLVAGLACLCACSGTRLERHGAPQQRVIARTYAVDLSILREAVRKNLRNARLISPIPLPEMNVIELKPPSYPPDWLAAWGDPGNFLSAYKQLPAAARADDLLLEEPTYDVYWPSEYESAAGPVKFRCGFILHFVPQTPSLTEVQVYEKSPEIWAGEHWAVLHEGIGFGKVHNIRFVEPTVKDRVDVLDALSRLAAAGVYSP